MKIEFQTMSFNSAGISLSDNPNIYSVYARDHLFNINWK